MIDKDQLNLLKRTQAVAAQTVTADVNGATVDMQGYRSVMFMADVGASGDVLSDTVYFEFEIEHSDDGATWVDAPDTSIRIPVSGASSTGTFAVVDDPAEDEAIYAGQYIGSKRYVRVVINVTGVHTNGTPVSIVALRAGAIDLPVS